MKWICLVISDCNLMIVGSVVIVGSWDCSGYISTEYEGRVFCRRVTMWSCLGLASFYFLFKLILSCDKNLNKMKSMEFND